MNHQLLIIGGGPYALSVAAAARSRGIDFRIVGKPMEFWRKNMPSGMMLRSGEDWHIDPLEEATFQAFLAATGRVLQQPIPAETYVHYVDWFCERRGIEVEPLWVDRLERSLEGLLARMADGSTLTARNVVAAVGFQPFAFHPPELAMPGSLHTCDLADLRQLEGLRCLIIGGRQSAFEWAALLRDRGVEVSLCYRHDTPRFELSDWSFVDPLLDKAESTPNWFLNLPDAERTQIAQKFWALGRAQVEPWLEPRIEGARLYPRTTVKHWTDRPQGLLVELNTGQQIEVDRVILATGYQVRTEKIPFLAPELLAEIDTNEGWPILDHAFQTTAPGLYLPGLTATRQFGPFFGFVRGCRATARMIVNGLKK